MSNESTKTLETYQNLINMGFDDAKSWDAANIHQGNLDKAINFLVELNDDNKENDIKYENVCDGDKECQAMDRLINTLKYHNKYKNDNNKISQYFNKNKHDIINDYHHILHQHVNEEKMTKLQSNKQFELIYKKITDKNNNLLCDISSCIIYKRNNRERERDKNDNNLSVYMDYLDCIHCYFLHSIDIGFRIINELNHDHDDDDDDNNNICFDKQLFALKRDLRSKRQNLEEIRGVNRIKNNKFITNFIDIDDNKINEIEERKDVNYSFGKRYDCWNIDKYGKYNDYDYKLSAKYSCLKSELLSNKIYALELNIFESAYQKALNLKHESNEIKYIKCNDNYYHYGIKSESLLINIDNILSIILYTDYDNLQCNFSLLFRNKCCIEKGNEFYYFIKLLTETVNCYGIKMDKSSINILYHGVSFIYFTKFISQFNSPTSTTTKQCVALNFAKFDGIILGLTKFNDICSGDLSCFNCSFISNFPNEEERLFIQPPFRNTRFLKFVSIYNIETDENYKDFINELTIFQQIINNKDHGDLENKLSSEMVSSLNDLMDISSNIDNKQYPKYIINSFNKWCKNIKTIQIDISDVNMNCIGLRIFDNNNNNLIQYDKMNKMFKEITEIRCYNVGKVNLFYLSSLLSILKVLNMMNDSKLIYIYLNGIKRMFYIYELDEYQSLFAQNGWKLTRCNKDTYISISRLL